MNKIVIILFLIINQNAIGQNCNYDFHNDDSYFSYQSNQDTAEIQNQVKCLETHLNKAVFINEKVWLANRIASMSAAINDSINAKKYALYCFKYDKTKFCSDYARLKVNNMYDTIGMSELHYLDQKAYSELSDIKNYCIEKSLKSALYKRKKKKEKEELQKTNSKYNVAYYNALQLIGEKDQLERHKATGDREVQNRLDEENRKSLDSLYSLYGMPKEELVSSYGFMNAFMVLHHSTDCDWNKKWTKRFLKEKSDVEYSFEKIFSYYFYRNFSEPDGQCKENIGFIRDLEMSTDSIYVKELLDFSKFTRNKP